MALLTGGLASTDDEDANNDGYKPILVILSSPNKESELSSFTAVKH